MRRVTVLKTYIEVYDVDENSDIIQIAQKSFGKIQTLQNIQIIKDSFITPYVKEIDFFEDSYFWDIDNGISD